MASLKKNSSISLMDWLKEEMFIKRMNSLPGWIVMALFGIGLAFSGLLLGPKAPLMVAAGLIGILFLLACLYYPEFSYYAYFFSCVAFALPARLAGIGIQVGITVEAVGYLCALSVLASQYRNRMDSANFWRTPISLMTILLFAYLLLEGFNPEINGSLEGWFNVIRKQFSLLVFYYISFLMFDSIEKIRRFIKYWIILALIIVIWGIKQQYFGFSFYEEAWIHSDPNIASLLFQGGVFRKFSLLADPAAFGVLMSASALFTLVLAIRIDNKKHKKYLFAATFLQMVASSYSGTRTCNVMLIGGLLAYIIFTLNEKRTIKVLFSAIGISLFVLFGPLSNSPLVNRMRTTFEAKKDPSNMLRDANRKNIQPYVYKHPIGGGLQTCGDEGLRFYPNHRLAGYPPDSGYVKIMLEQGWIGLALNIIFYFIILQVGITGFYDARNQEVKTYFIAFTVCFFSLFVGQYSQLAVSQYPMYLFYTASLVIFYKLKEYDTKLPEDDEQPIS